MLIIKTTSVLFLYVQVCCVLIQSHQMCAFYKKVNKEQQEERKVKHYLDLAFHILDNPINFNIILIILIV